uniref:Small ribosomal subunit protein uS17c n=1 Tax=Oryza punctata TaxID=4537 RepID=A0A0E0KX83_ORYPU
MLLTTPFVSSPLRVQANGGSGASWSGVATAVTIQAAKQLTGRVVTTKADKTVGVEVVRLAPHPKYKRRERIKKKYQAHDPDNQFKVGDVVELRRSRPISKTKHFLAVPLPPRDTRRKSQLLPPLQSDQDQPVKVNLHCNAMRQPQQLIKITRQAGAAPRKRKAQMKHLTNDLSITSIAILVLKIKWYQKQQMVGLDLCETTINKMKVMTLQGAPAKQHSKPVFKKYPKPKPANSKVHEGRQWIFDSTVAAAGSQGGAHSSSGRSSGVLRRWLHHVEGVMEEVRVGYS